MKTLALKILVVWLVGFSRASTQENPSSPLSLDEVLDLMDIKVIKLACPPIGDGSKKWKFTIEVWKGSKMMKTISTTEGDYVVGTNIVVKFPTSGSPTWKIRSESTIEESSEPVILSENGAVAWHLTQEKALKRGKHILALRTDGITEPLRGDIEERRKQVATLDSEYSQYMVFSMEVE